MKKLLSRIENIIFEEGSPKLAAARVVQGMLDENILDRSKIASEDLVMDYIKLASELAAARSKNMEIDAPFVKTDKLELAVSLGEDLIAGRSLDLAIGYLIQILNFKNAINNESEIDAIEKYLNDNISQETSDLMSVIDGLLSQEKFNIKL